MIKNIKTTFEEWCIENNTNEILSLWDYSLNIDSPNNISRWSTEKRYFKCNLKHTHSPELKTIQEITVSGKLKCNQCNSFGQWCEDNEHEDYLDLWDYEINKISPFNVDRGSSKKFYFKCYKGAHKSELKQISIYTSKVNNNIIKCKQCNSFGQCLIDTYGKNALDIYWDKENTIDPFTISKQSGKNVFINCINKPYHKSYKITPDNFNKGNRCPYCKSNSGKIHSLDSFAQYHIDNTDKDFLEKYWDYDKNTIDPFKITKSNHNKVWVKCQEKEYHGSYEIRCGDFAQGYRCSYCGNQKVHRLDSIGILYPKSLDLWSSKNISSPYDFSRCSEKMVCFICHNGIHDEYMRSIKNSTKADFNCPECDNSKGEITIGEYLTKNIINYIPQKRFEGLFGLGKCLLSYDFYMPNYNLLIEYQGQQHYEPIEYFGGEKQFKIQQEHDKRKREYAKLHSINLLEIPYWEFNNINQILNKKLF